MPDFEFKVEKPIAVLSTSSKGWTKEVNMVSWNGREAKLDIREWAPGENINERKMGKGITFTTEEAKQLKKALNSMEEL